MKAQKYHLLVLLGIVLVGSCHSADMVGDREVTYYPLAQNWFTAFEICRAEGKQLLTIHNDEENGQIAAIAEKYQVRPAFWLGANDLGQEGNFVYTFSGQKVAFARFNPGQPDNANEEDCLEISYRFNNGPKWNDIPCLDKNPYFCEEIKDKVDPPAQFCTSIYRC